MQNGGAPYIPGDGQGAQSHIHKGWVEFTSNIKLENFLKISAAELEPERRSCSCLMNWFSSGFFFPFCRQVTVKLSDIADLARCPVCMGKLLFFEITFIFPASRGLFLEILIFESYFLQASWKRHVLSLYACIDSVVSALRPGFEQTCRF